MSEGLPVGWVATTLGVLVKPSGARLSPSQIANVPYVGLEHVQSATLKISGHGSSSEVRSASLQFLKGDVLYGKMRPYLNKVWVAEFDGLCSAEFLVFPSQQYLSSKFLALRLSADDFVKYANSRTSGERPRVDFKKLASFPIHLPPLEEQNRICERLELAFAQIDRGVEAVTRARGRIARYRSAVVQSGVMGRLTLAWRDRHTQTISPNSNGRVLLERTLSNPGHLEAPRLDINASNGLNKIPNEWAVASPIQLAKRDSGSIGAGPFGTIFKARDFRSRGVPIIFLRHVTEGHYSTDKPGFMDRKIWAKLFREYSVFGGELLIAKLGDPPGVCCIYPRGIGPAMVTPDVIKFSVNEDAANPRFLMHYFNSGTARSITSGVAFGMTRLRLTLALFRQMPVPLPGLSEQSAIVDEIERRLAAAGKLDSRLAEQGHRADKIRASLLSQAFQGTLVPQTRGESAEDQLKKIQSNTATVTSRRGRFVMTTSKQPASRQSLLTTLKQHGRPMTPEELFQASGHSQETVDDFFSELRELTNSPPKIAQERTKNQARILIRLVP